MNEDELMDVLTDIDEKYIEKAFIQQDTTDKREKGNNEFILPKRKIYIAVSIISLSIAIVLLTVTGTNAYQKRRERKERESIVKDGNTEKALVNIPEGITRIRIIDGTIGDVIILDEGDVDEFFSKFDVVSGMVEYVGEGSGYRYAVMCYREEEWVMSFEFMSEKIIKENVGEAGVDRRFTSEETIPAYEYIERLFENGRAGR